MRRLMLFTIGFAMACIVGTYFFSITLFWITILCACASVIILYICKRKHLKFAAKLFVVAIGFLVGLGWFTAYQYLYLSSAAKVDGQELRITAEISDYSVTTDYGVSAKGRIILNGRRYPVVLYLDEDCIVKPGDRVSGIFRFRMTHDGLQNDTYHRGSGIFLLAYSKGRITRQSSNEIPLKYFPATLRKTISSRIDLLYSEDTAFLAKALMLGDRRGVDYETNTAFKVSGISHIVAVSGLHVSILYSVIYLFAGRKRLFTALIGVPTLILFAAVTGFTPSVTRACVMQILFILADLFLKEYDPPTALSAAVLLMLSINPIAISSGSLQLSVGCMIGIFLFSERIRHWICNFSCWKQWKGKTFKVYFRNWVAAGVSVTLSSMFFTTPLVAYYFGCVSLVGILTNLLTLWAVSWIFYGTIIVCIGSLIWYQGASILAWLIDWLIRYILTLSRIISSFPLAAVYTTSRFIIAWVAICYCLVLLFFLFKKRKPYLYICTAVISLAFALLLSWVTPMTANSRITILDVGQGQCVLLQAKGKNYLVDCGGDNPSHASDVASEALLSMGIYRLDGVILTHYDNDHAAGIPYLLSRIQVDYVFLPEYSEDAEIKQKIIDAAGNTVYFVREDLDLCWEDTKLSIFAPLLQSDDNESGLCILFSGKNCDILITGDLDISGENKLVLNKNIPQLTALIAGHHGSSYSTGEPLLAATDPEYVFISVGQNNRYGHPSREVLDRLGQYHCTVYRTDQQGTIVFRR